MWCVASRPPRSSVVGFLEPDHPGSALGGLSAHDEHTSASSGESSASGQESMVVPPASRTSGAAASPKCSTSSVTPLASTVVMRPAPLRRSRSRRALRTEPRSVSSCRAFPRVHPLRATAEFVYGAHNHQARVRLACGFHNGVWSARLEEPCTAERVPETATGPTETPASCRSVAEVSFANGGFVARTRFGVFGQAMSRYGSRTLRRGFSCRDLVAIWLAYTGRELAGGVLDSARCGA